MRKVDSGAFAASFLTFSEMEDHLPLPMTRARAIRLSHIGRFPPFIRPSGRKSEPCWKRADVVRWIREKYGKIVPEMIADIEAALAPPTPNKRSRK